MPPTVHAHLLDLLHSRVFCLPLNPYITISSFLLQLSISPAQEQKASVISSASFPLLTHLQFPFHPWFKAHTQILPSLPFYFPFPFLYLFCAFLQFPSCPAPNPALPSVQGGRSLAVLARGHPAAPGPGGACPVLALRSVSCLPGTQLFAWQKPR